jgi:WD40-like Beta Propeller Repeat
LRPEHSFDEHLVWPISTPPAAVLERVQARAAHLRRRRRLQVAGAGVPLAVVAVLAATLLPGAPGGTSRVKIRPAVERPGGGGRDVGPVDGGAEAPPAPSSVADAWPIPLGPAAPLHPSAEWGALPGPFMPMRSSSPLGRWVIERAGAIVVMNPDGSGVRTVVPADARMTQPDWAPDGRRLVATHVTMQIAVIEMDGTYRFVSPVGQLAGAPKWSPDGSRIMYEVTDQHLAGRKTPTRLWTVRPDGSDAREIVAEGAAADWHPDGSRIVYNCPVGWLCTANADGTGERRIAGGRYAEWSPDGSRLAVVKAVQGVSMWLTMRPDGSDERPLAAITAIDPGRLDWSADSQWLVYLQPETCLTCTSKSSVHAVRFDGTDGRLMLSGFPDNWISVGPPGV